VDTEAEKAALAYLAVALVDLKPSWRSVEGATVLWPAAGKSEACNTVNGAYGAKVAQGTQQIRSSPGLA